MRTALFSDVHGDATRLRQVLADIENQQCDRMICLGDVVNGGVENKAIVQLLAASNIICVRGNHDENPSVKLSAESRAALRSWPEEIVEGEVIFTHVSPRLKKRKIKTDFEVWNVFDDVKYRRIFIGDVHIPMLWGENNAPPVSAIRYPIVYDEPFLLASDDRYLICVGAVSRSRDRDERARYVVFDEVENLILFRAVETS